MLLLPLRPVIMHSQTMKPLNSDGCVQVRNRHMSKRETEKLVKEVWHNKMSDTSGGRDTELVDFLYTFLQKKVGIQSAVVEARALSPARESYFCTDSACLSLGKSVSSIG